ncbi:MAG: DUF4147 domain-containing protein, partial [Actinomycetota bacterium]|nr:DUF4147 domain-containing protein [Actinomycetota bacterium]
RTVVFALGKAALAMSWGAATALGTERLEGLVVSNYEDRVPEGTKLMIGSHPIPDQSSIEAGEALLDLAASLDEEDLAIVLISGGGSALAEVPVPDVTVADLAVTNEVLLRSGADILETNVVRRRLSRLKGGGLAAAIAPAPMVALVVSDVVGDSLVAIASGPTIAATDAEGAAWEVIDRFGVRNLLPESVVAALQQTPQPLGPMPQQEIKVIASGPVAAHAAAAEAQRRGFPATVVDTRIAGEALVTAGEVLSRSKGSVSVFAGETTVSVTGDGIGGRNHEAALAAATIIDGNPHVYFLAAGTDGIDGMAQAAGAFVDGTTVTRARALGLDAAEALERNDSGTFFGEMGDQLITGPTGTNVGDLWLVLRTN